MTWKVYNKRLIQHTWVAQNSGHSDGLSGLGLDRFLEWDDNLGAPQILLPFNSL